MNHHISHDNDQWGLLAPNSNKVTIETPRLVLRGALPTDDEDLYESFQDAEVMKYWESLPHTSVDVTRTWLQKMIDGRNNGITDFVICLKAVSDNAASNVPDPASGHTVHLPVIGKVGIWHDSEIGFLLNRRCWKRGLAVEALREVLDLWFGVSDKIPQDQIQRQESVVADVDPRNAASLGVLRKLGFVVYATKEKTFLVGDEWVDSVYLSLQRDVWLQKRTEI